jgi:hypothetical protein
MASSESSGFGTGTSALTGSPGRFRFSRLPCSKNGRIEAGSKSQEDEYITSFANRKARRITGSDGKVLRKAVRASQANAFDAQVNCAAANFASNAALHASFSRIFATMSVKPLKSEKHR